MPSPDFAIRVYGERLDQEQRRAMGAFGCLVLYIAARADATSHTVFVNLEEFAVWAGCGYSTARKAWDEVERLQMVLDVKRRSHGYVATLGAMFQRAQMDATLAVRVYEKVMHRRPHASEREAINATVGTGAGDLKLWRLVCEQWKGNPADTTAMLECFTRKRDSARRVLAPASASGSEPPGLRD